MSSVAHKSTARTPVPVYDQPISHDWRVEVFYDGDCPLCVKEIDMIRRFDGDRRIRFTNIADKSFRADDYGKTFDEFMDKIQGRLRDGTWIEGVEVFRQLYAAIGLWPVIWVTRLPGIKHMLNAGYNVFAKNRLRWTGRCSPDGECDVPPADKK